MKKQKESKKKLIRTRKKLMAEAVSLLQNSLVQEIYWQQLDLMWCVIICVPRCANKLVCMPSVHSHVIQKNNNQCCTLVSKAYKWLAT